MNFHFWVFTVEVDDPRRIIDRTIVDKEEFPVVDRLLQYALNGVAKKTSVISRGNVYSDKRH